MKIIVIAIIIVAILYLIGLEMEACAKIFF